MSKKCNYMFVSQFQKTLSFGQLSGTTYLCVSKLQFSRAGKSLPAGRSVLQTVQRYVRAHPAADHAMAHLAARAVHSPRHFARLFHDEVGLTLAEWVEAAGVAAARRLLEGARQPPNQVAARSGWSSDARSPTAAGDPFAMRQKSAATPKPGHCPHGNVLAPRRRTFSLTPRHRLSADT